MKAPIAPDNESERLQALRKCLILDTPPEERFDRLTRLAVEVFGIQIALVSLVDSQRQWFKSRQGLDACETARDISFCGHAILGADIFHVEDARQDPRFHDNPLVTGPPHIRFYAGAPLHTADGHRIGTLCIIHDKPRDLSAKEQRILRNLADCVENEINNLEIYQQQQALHLNQQLSKAISHVQSHVIRQSSRQMAFDNLLKDILSITQSEFGFIGEVRQTPAQRPYLKTYAISNIAWDDESRAYYEVSAPKGMEFYNLKSLFGAALLNNEPVIANDAMNDPRSGGLPHGHPRLDTFLGIPISHGDEMVAMLGIANRAAGYGPETIEFLHPVLVTIGQLVEALRVQQLHRENLVELARLSQVASQTTNGVIITDKQGRVEWINEGFTRLSGYTLEDMLGQIPADILSGPNTDPNTIAVINESIKRAEAYDVSVNYYHNSGRPYWTHISCNPLRDEQDQLQGFLSIETDITREKNDAERIRTSEHRLASVIVGTNIGTWEWNVQTGDIVIDERWAEIGGYTLSDLEPTNIQTWLDMLHPEDLHKSRDMLQQHFANELDYFDIQCRIRHKDGHWIWVRNRGRVISWTENGEPQLMYGSHFDITENILAEAAVRDQAQHTQVILDNIMDGIITINEDGIIDSLNPAAEKIFGYQADDVLQKKIQILIPNLSNDKDTAYLHKYNTNSKESILGINQEMEGQHKNGNPFPIELTVTQITRREQQMFVCMVRDISERKRMERMKSEFLATVSHELRTPLTSISGALGLLSQGNNNNLTASNNEMIDIAYRNSQRLTMLINDLLDIEKLEAGKMRFHLQAQPIMPLITQALDINKSYGGEHEVKLELVNTHSDVHVLVDGQRLIQVLSNLLSNAIKYSPANKTVKVSVDIIDDTVRITVIDQGPGVSPQFRDRIFQKFAQADSSDTRQKGGTGLGLAITKELVERMRGSIGFTSEDGKGARFFFTLPIWKDSQSPH